MWLMDSGLVSLSSNASMTELLLYSLPRPQATTGVWSGCWDNAQFLHLNDLSASLSFYKKRKKSISEKQLFFYQPK